MLLGKVFNTNDSWGLIFTRLAAGTIFTAHGAQKLFGLFGGAGIHQTISYFQQGLGIPTYLALLAMTAEFLGGIALILGCMTRLAALSLAAVMGVAIYKVHLVHGFFINGPHQDITSQGFEFNLALLGMALTLIFTGSGHLSVDKWLSER